MSELKTVEVACNNCGLTEFRRFSWGTDFEYETTRDEFLFVQCSNCSLVYLNPRPAVSELARIYPRDYLAYNLVEDDLQARDSLAFRLRREFYTGKMRRALAKIDMTNRDSIDFLDIGAGDGRLLNFYRQIPGVEMRTYAVEMNSGAAEILRKQGHTVFEGVYDAVEPAEDSFDIVHSSHVIEHVPDPRGFAEKSHKLLRNGGLFLCETPNIDCTDARLFRNSYWGGYHFPRHWTLYTKETLTWMLKDVGYEILDVKYYPNPVFWVWTLHHVLKENGFPAFVWKMFPVIEVFDNSFVNMIRLGILTVVDRFLSLFSGGRMGSMMITARKVMP